MRSLADLVSDEAVTIKPTQAISRADPQEPTRGRAAEALTKNCFRGPSAESVAVYTVTALRKPVGEEDCKNLGQCSERRQGTRPFLSVHAMALQ